MQSGTADTTASTLKLKYNELWRQGYEALCNGTFHTETPPEEGNPRWGLSAVLRVDGLVGDHIAAELHGLDAASAGPHLMHRPQDLHCTIRSLEGFQSTIPKRQVKHYCRSLAQSVRGLPPIQVELQGLGGGPNGIFAHGYPSDSLQILRERMHTDQLTTGPLGAASVDTLRTRDTCHVSLMVFRPPATVETALADYVAARTRRSYGLLDVKALSLVRYFFGANTVTMQELACVPMPT